VTPELEAIFEQLESRSTRQVLDDLARVGATLAKHARARPEVELHLTSGPIVRGRLISLSDQGSILVHTGGTPKSPSVAFVRLDQVAAVTVADASLLAKSMRSDAPVPSKLELQRQCASRADGLSASLGHPVTIELAAIDLDDDGRRAIGVALPLVQEVLHAIASDAMGKEALAKIATIELGSTDTLEVTVDRRRLTIRAPKLLAEQPDHAALRKAIEKLC
jgi:hypothetical protein